MAGIRPGGIIDMHAHVYPEDCLAEVIKARPEFTLEHSARGLSLLCRGSHTMSAPREDDLRARLETMDDAGVAVQVLSIGALNLGWAGAGAIASARLINDRFAAICRQHPDRFRFVAALPWSTTEALVAELDRALDLGAAGVGITTTIADYALDAPELGTFWSEAQRRGLLVLVHPAFPPNGPSNDQGEYLAVGYLGETAMAAAKLVFGGVMEVCPDVRLVWSHCGGSLPMLVDRLDRSYKRYEKCLRPPSEYLRNCFYDTACMHGPALDCARATFGVERLVYGTDEPHVPHATRGVLDALRDRPWPAADLERVLSGNARQLLAP